MEYWGRVHSNCHARRHEACGNRARPSGIDLVSRLSAGAPRGAPASHDMPNYADIMISRAKIIQGRWTRRVTMMVQIWDPSASTPVGATIDGFKHISDGQMTAHPASPSALCLTTLSSQMWEPEPNK